MRIVILPNQPYEVERLKRYDKIFQIITWAVIITAYGFTWLPFAPPIEINRLGATIVVTIAALSEIFVYNILPFEKTTGFIRYQYKLKGFTVGVMNHVLVTAFMLFTGGGTLSPFVFIYSLPLVSAAIYLPLWAVIFELVEIGLLYSVATAFVAPQLGVPPITGVWDLAIIPINISALTLIVALTYPQARELSKESERNFALATELARTSGEIEAERNKLKVILSGIHDGIIALDKDTRVIFANPAAERITKTEEGEMLGKPVDEIIQFSENDKKISSLEFCPIGENRQDRVIFAKEYIRVVTPKNKAYVSVISSTIREAEAANLGCILTFWDVTAEKQLEEMKIDFVSMAVHELRTPLTTIRGYIAVLEEEILKKLTQEETQDFQKIKIAAKQLSALVENLLNVSRIERGALKLEVEAVDWTNLVELVVSEFVEMAKQKGLKLIYQKPKIQLPKVAVDKFRIAEVLSNLLSNAIAFTKQGKVTVAVKKQGRHIVTLVSDTGPGIPATAVPNLFTKFFRVSGILEHGSKGTGLGLFIAKSIVELHNGKIWVETKLGEGSTFYFSVPVYSAKFQTRKNYFLQTKPVIVN